MKSYFLILLFHVPCFSQFGPWSKYGPEILGRRPVIHPPPLLANNPHYEAELEKRPIEKTPDWYQNWKTYRELMAGHLDLDRPIGTQKPKIADINDYYSETFPTNEAKNHYDTDYYQDEPSTERPIMKGTKKPDISTDYRDFYKPLSSKLYKTPRKVRSNTNKLRNLHCDSKSTSQHFCNNQRYYLPIPKNVLEEIFEASRIKRQNQLNEKVYAKHNQGNFYIEDSLSPLKLFGVSYTQVLLPAKIKKAPINFANGNPYKKYIIDDLVYRDSSNPYIKFSDDNLLEVSNDAGTSKLSKNYYTTRNGLRYDASNSKINLRHLNELFSEFNQIDQINGNSNRDNDDINLESNHPKMYSKSNNFIDNNVKSKNPVPINLVNYGIKLNGFKEYNPKKEQQVMEIGEPSKYYSIRTEEGDLVLYTEVPNVKYLSDYIHEPKIRNYYGQDYLDNLEIP